MTMKKRYFFGFFGITACVVMLVTFTLALLSDTTLRVASKNCDTIKISAVYDDAEKTLNAQQSITYKNRTNQILNEIKFHIYANAYRDGAKNPPVTNDEVPTAYPNGKNFGGINIQNINDGAIIPTIDGIDETVLIVPLTTPLAVGKSTKIDIKYAVTLANIKHRLGYTDLAVNLANFYPVPVMFENGTWRTYPYSSNGDPFFNAVHNFDVTMTAPDNFIMASSGTIQKEKTKNGQRTTHLKSTAIRDFAMVLSTSFHHVTKRLQGVQISYYYLDDKLPEKSLNVAQRALQTFSMLFSKYPYHNLTVVQTDFLHGGMEYGELVYVSRDMLPDRANHDYVIVHEIAHQWWFGMVGNNQSSTAWIDEGLAEYSTMLYYERNPDHGIERKTAIENARKSYTSYVNLIRSLGMNLDTTMNRDLADFDTSYEYVYMTYVRGFLLFCDLENYLSAPALISALSQFCKENKFGIATQKSLISAIENHTHTKVNLFFTSYLNGLYQSQN